MLTIFATPRPFKGHIGIIQRDAIRSWTLLRPRPEIILIGDDEGTEEICAEYDLRWVAEVQRNESGTPLVRSVFAMGQAHASSQIVCYTNADIIFLNDLLDAVGKVRELTQGRAFLLLGGRWNVAQIELELLDRPDREAALKTYVAAHGLHDSRIAMDYFVFPKNFAWELPDFAIGRAAWDSWLPYHARRRGIPVIDGSKAITAIHQDHNYAHFHRGEVSVLHTPEGKQNMRLLGLGRRYTIASANFELTAAGPLATHNRLRILRDRLQEYEVWLVYQLRCWWPYSYPLYVGLRGLKRGAKWLGRRAQALAPVREK